MALPRSSASTPSRARACCRSATRSASSASSSSPSASTGLSRLNLVAQRRRSRPHASDCRRGLPRRISSAAYRLALLLSLTGWRCGCCPAAARHSSTITTRRIRWATAVYHLRRVPRVAAVYHLRRVPRVYAVYHLRRVPRVTAVYHLRRVPRATAVYHLRRVPRVYAGWVECA